MGGKSLIWSNFAPDSHRLANDICMDGCINSKVTMNNSYSYTKYILWFLLCASVTWKETQFYLQVSSINVDRARFSRSTFYCITKQLQHVQIHRATEVLQLFRIDIFVVQCSKNCRLMQLFSNEVYSIHIVCEVWPSLEASPGRIQSVAGRLGQLTATRGINQIIHENEFPFWYWDNYLIVGINIQGYYVIVLFGFLFGVIRNPRTFENKQI